jgi:predicted transcriptional regulator
MQGNAIISLYGLTKMPTIKENGQFYDHIKVSTVDGTPLLTAAGLSIPKHNNIELSYSGDNLSQVVYKLDAQIVGSLTLTYSGSKLTSVSKT